MSFDVTWRFKESWHAESEDRDEGLKALCGDKLPEDSKSSKELPRNERTCERCLEELAVVNDQSNIMPSTEPILPSIPNALPD